MEYLINLHSAEYLFYGGRPTTVSESVKKHSLGMGMSAQMAAKDSNKGLKISARGFANAVRQHRPHVIPTDLLNWRYTAVRMRAGPPEGPQTDLPALELLLEFQKRKPDVALVKKDDNSAYLVPLLSLVQKAVADDVKHLSFDYFAMHQRCWGLLEQLQKDLREDLAMIGRTCGENYLGTDQMTFRHIPGAIFNCVAAVQENGGGRISMQLAQMARLVINTQKAVKRIAEEKGSVGLDEVSQILATHVEEAEPDSGSSSMPKVTSVDTDDDSSVDGQDFAAYNAMLDCAPKLLVTDAEAKVAYKKMKKTPFNKMPASVQELGKGLQAKGADLSKGLMGLMKAQWDATADWTPEQMDRVCATTSVEEYNELLKTFEREAAGNAPRLETITDVTDGKKKRNNKNKNKNRKLKQKEARASGVGDEEESDTNAGAAASS